MKKGEAEAKPARRTAPKAAAKAGDGKAEAPSRSEEEGGEGRRVRLSAPRIAATKRPRAALALPSFLLSAAVLTFQLSRNLFMRPDFSSPLHAGW